MQSVQGARSARPLLSPRYRTALLVNDKGPTSIGCRDVLISLIQGRQRYQGAQMCKPNFRVARLKGPRSLSALTALNNGEASRLRPAQQGRQVPK